MTQHILNFKTICKLLSNNVTVYCTIIRTICATLVSNSSLDRRRIDSTVEAIRILLAILLGEVVLLLIWSQRQRKFPDLRFYLRLR